MNRRPPLRRLIGTILLVVFIAGYCLIAMGVAVSVLPQTGAFWHFVFYAVAGLAWVPPAGFIIQWMYRPRPGDGGAASP